MFNDYKFISIIVILSSIAVLFSSCDKSLQQQSPVSCNYKTQINSSCDSCDAKHVLISTQFQSFDELKKLINIKYHENSKGKRSVELRFCDQGFEASTLLYEGVSETDYTKASTGGLLKQFAFLFKYPSSVYYRKDILHAFYLSRTRANIFGPLDLAFYNISEFIRSNINTEYSRELRKIDLESEKGYLNTINHVLAQTFMTCLFSETVADLMVDAHERKTLPALVSGNFSEQQIADLKNGPLDNYIDMINNEWGQEIGKTLKSKYQINRQTHWDGHLLSDCLNHLQGEFSWFFGVAFNPFTPDDDRVLRFAQKINHLKLL